MKTRKNKVAKAAKTKLSDLTPKGDARGGRLPESPRPDGGPDPFVIASATSRRGETKKRFFTS